MLEVDLSPQAYIDHHNLYLKLDMFTLCPSGPKILSINRLVQNMKNYALQHVDKPAQFANITNVVDLLKKILM